jgi:outer membrane protein assembly factor BamB
VNDPTPDADWGTSPTLFRGTQGRELVSAVNKNGILYAFDRDKLGAGPVWRARLAVPQGGSDPGSGGGYSTGVFDGHRLVYAAGRTTIRGKRRPGSVRAIDPATGRFLWERPLPSQVYGALACANGMVVVPAIAALYVVDPATGEVLLVISGRRCPRCSAEPSPTLATCRRRS